MKPNQACTWNISFYKYCAVEDDMIKKFWKTFVEKKRELNNYMLPFKNASRWLEDSNSAVLLKQWENLRRWSSDSSSTIQIDSFADAQNNHTQGQGWQGGHSFCLFVGFSLFHPPHSHFPSHSVDLKLPVLHEVKYPNTNLLSCHLLWFKADWCRLLHWDSRETYSLGWTPELFWIFWNWFSDLIRL